MAMNADQMKAAILKYWRYDRQHPLVALEANSALESWNDGGQADILVVTEERQLIETEVKLSIADLRRDKQKNKHELFHRAFFHRYLIRYPTWHFYFAVPYELANQVCLICDQLYPYAGVLGVKESVGHGDEPTYFEVTSYRNPKQLGYKNKKLAWRELRNMVRAQSATLCRLSQHVAELRQALKSQYKGQNEGPGESTRK
ncbi:hypothetical protein ES703_12187 [subsurface metagenome]